MQDTKVVYCLMLSFLFHLFSIFFLNDIITASIDLCILTNIRATPTPNKIPPTTYVRKIKLSNKPNLALVSICNYLFKIFFSAHSRERNIYVQVTNGIQIHVMVTIYCISEKDFPQDLAVDVSAYVITDHLLMITVVIVLTHNARKKPVTI